MAKVKKMIMKKNLFVAAAMMVAMTACVKEADVNVNVEENVPQAEEKVWVEFTAGVETKAVLDGTVVKWEEGDEISINGEVFPVSEISDDKLTAKFKKEVAESFLAVESFTAVYPASADKGNRCFQIPAVSNGTAKVVAVATVEEIGETLNFRHLTSFFKFQVPSEVSVVTISSDVDVLAGTVTDLMFVVEEKRVGYDWLHEDHSMTLTVQLDGGAKLQPGTDYYVAVLPGVKQNLSVSIDGKVSKTWTDDVNIEYAMIANMGVLPVAKAPRNLAFSAATASATYGEDFTEPTLTGVKDDVQYTSSNTAVATVNATTGEVTLKAGGSTTITASAPESDLYLSGSVSYTLTVKENAVIRINNMNGWGDMSITVKVGSTTLVNKKSMTNKGDNVFEYTLSPENVGKKVTYYIEHSWYQTSTKEITLTADTQTTPISLNTTYLQTNDWEVDGAVFTVEFKGTGVSTKVVDAVKVKDKFYEIEVPSGNYTKATFRRCNPSDKSVWNKSKEVTLKHMCFCIEGWDENHHGDNRWY